MTDGSFDNHQPGSSASPDWEAIARHMAGESPLEKDGNIEHMLDEDPTTRKLLAELNQVTTNLRSEAAAGIDVDAALQKVKAQPGFSGIASIDSARRKAFPDTSPRRWRMPMPLLAAAALIAVGVASWQAYENRPHQQAAAPAAVRMLATGVGVRDSIVLSDGTRVFIGPLSSVKVAADFGASSREVTVTGDAWFDVVHDAGKPFTVHAGTATITDVGTKFAVRTDAAAGVAVSVTEGAVSLRQVNSPTHQGVILKAGDKGLVRNSGAIDANRGAASDEDVAWLHGRLVFRDASLGEVASSMRKWYGIEMKVEDKSLANQHLTATFAGEPADRVLEVIRLALGADIERHGDTAIVRSTKGSMRSR